VDQNLANEYVGLKKRLEKLTATVIAVVQQIYSSLHGELMLHILQQLLV